MADLEGYKPPLRQFLNTHMRKHRQTSADPQVVELFRESCETVFEVLGSAPFRVLGSKNVLNKAMFDAVMIPVARADQKALRERASEFRNLVEGLPEEDKFTTAIGRATADKQRMLYRIGRVADGIRSMGVAVDLPAGLGLDAATGSESDII